MNHQDYILNTNKDNKYMLRYSAIIPNVIIFQIQT